LASPSTAAGGRALMETHGLLDAGTTMSTESNVTNRKREVQLQRMIAEVKAEILRRGFHGTATVELKVQDGTIQQIVRSVHRIER